MTRGEKIHLSYRDAGVDIDSGNRLVERIRPFAERTRRPGVLGRLGGFSALFRLSALPYLDPVLVSTTDGVGTKVKLALEMRRHDTIGIDLVAMCVNDLVVVGAEPLLFLDYYATGRLDVEVAARVVEGIAKGCEIAGAALVGGETAEMPSMYQEGDHDLAGFCVGIVEYKHIIDGSTVQPGDALLGIASSGPHANGYSLIRKVLAATGSPADEEFQGRRLCDVLLEPTRIYAKPVLDVARRLPLRAAAHITGGGLMENLPRVIPANLRAVVDTKSWTRPAIFDWLQSKGGIAEQEMRRIFNCGIGMVLVVREGDVEAVRQQLADHGETAFRIGMVDRWSGAGARVDIR